MYGEIDGVKIGVVVATKSNPSFPELLPQRRRAERPRPARTAARSTRPISSRSRSSEVSAPRRDVARRREREAERYDPAMREFGEFYSLAAEFFGDECRSEEHMPKQPSSATAGDHRLGAGAQLRAPQRQDQARREWLPRFRVPPAEKWEGAAAGGGPISACTTRLLANRAKSPREKTNGPITDDRPVFYF